VSTVRDQIRAAVERIAPIDPLEQRHKAETLAWIDSGAELCRIAKPAMPPSHLVSYFALVTHEEILLVDHINAQLWLPCGGHVESGELPSETVQREVREELGIEADFVFADPLFVTITQTVGLTAGHTDVSLWLALRGQREQQLRFDPREFHSVRWFGFEELPLDRCDPHLGRFVTKLRSMERNE
jgi:8-oxo-dGTP diphosphatase